VGVPERPYTRQILPSIHVAALSLDWFAFFVTRILARCEPPVLREKAVDSLLTTPATLVAMAL
jgi:hypothetical protein